jgi:hypothetical protein
LYIYSVLTYLSKNYIVFTLKEFTFKVEESQNMFEPNKRSWAKGVNAPEVPGFKSVFSGEISVPKKYDQCFLMETFWKKLFQKTEGHFFYPKDEKVVAEKLYSPGPKVSEGDFDVHFYAKDNRAEIPQLDKTKGAFLQAGAEFLGDDGLFLSFTQIEELRSILWNKSNVSFRDTNSKGELILNLSSYMRLDLTLSEKMICSSDVFPAFFRKKR